MRKPRGSSANDPNKDREESWKKIFKGLFGMIEDQQRQLESFVKERKSLEKRIQLQHDRWVFDVKLLEDHISQIKRDSESKDMTRFVEAAKANLIISMKQKEATMHRLKFEDVDDERADLKLVFDELSKCLTERERVTRSNSKNVDGSTLKAERDFAWNQFEKTDAKLQEHAKRAKSEIQAANDKLQKLTCDLEESQALNLEKNRTISALQDDITVLKSDSRKKSEEISRLTKEVELLRGDPNRCITPVLRRCMLKSDTSANGDKNSRSSGLGVMDKVIGTTGFA